VRCVLPLASAASTRIFHPILDVSCHVLLHNIDLYFPGHFSKLGI